MNKIYWSLLILFFSLSFSSCMSDDDDDVDYDWKNYQTSVYDNISTISNASGERIYTGLKSESGNGYVYWKTSDFITNRMQGDFSQKQPDVYTLTRSISVKPSALTDSVVVRYEGWYYDKEGEYVRFDGTEKITESKPPYYGTNNNIINGNGVKDDGVGFAVSGAVDGFRTTIMDMEINEERITCIPSNMGYGSTATTSIPANTTIFFDIKLLKIYSGDGTLIADATETE